LAEDVQNAGGIASTLGLDMDPYAQGMLRAESIAKLFPGVVQSYLASPLLGLIDIGKQVATALTRNFSTLTNAADDMGDLATAVGVSIENLSALGLAASLSGATAGDVADAYKFLGQSIASAMSGKGADYEMFRMLGIAFTDAEGRARPLEAVMMEVADALATLPAGAARTDAAMKLLGKAGTNLIPTLSQGSDALTSQMNTMSAYGAVVTAESNKSADRWNDAMGEMSIAWTGFKMQLLEPVREALVPVIERIVGKMREAAPDVQAALQSTVDVVSAGVASIGEAVQSVGPYLDWFGEHWRDVAAVVGGAVAFMAGPAVVGAVVAIGPAIAAVGPAVLSVVAPVTALRVAATLLFGALNPLGVVTRLVSVGLGLLTAAAIQNPAVVAQIGEAMQPVVEVGRRLYEIVATQIAPALSGLLSQAVTRIVSLLPSGERVVESLTGAFKTYADFLVGVWYPAIGAAINAVLGAVESAMPTVQTVLKAAWAVLASIAEWIISTAVPIIGDAFAAAWGVASAAVAAAMPYVDAAWAQLQSVADWIVSTAVPAIGVFFVDAWNAVQPAIEAAGGLIATIYSSVLAPLIGWILSTAVPAIGEVFVAAWNILTPIVAGLGPVLLGVWEIAKVALSRIGDQFNLLSSIVSGLAGVIGWVWSNVLQPVIGWIWSAVKPALEFVANLLGGLLGLIGKVLSGIASVVGSGPSLTEQVQQANDAAARSAAPTAQPAPPVTTAPTPSTPAVPLPAVPRPPVQPATPAPSLFQPPVTIEPPKIEMPDFKQLSAELLAGARGAASALSTPAGVATTPPAVPGALGQNLDIIGQRTRDAVEPPRRRTSQEPPAESDQDYRRRMAQTRKGFEQRERDTIRNGGSWQDVQAVRDERGRTLRDMREQRGGSAASGSASRPEPAAANQKPAVQAKVDAVTINLDPKQVAIEIGNQLKPFIQAAVEQKLAGQRARAVAQEVADYVG
jgi:phage-related protein